MGAGHDGSSRRDATPEAGAESRPSVVYEDEWLLAACKPAGLLVHGDGTGARTLTDLVREHLVEAGEREAAGQLQAAQRLDVDTTGIVLFSKSKEFQPGLDALVAGHDPSRMRKRYLAVVRGAFPWEECEISAGIARDRHDARRMRAVPDGRPGARSLTRVRRLAVTGARAARLSLVLAELGTGRRHQIRVHLASRGFPILGDRLYGAPADRAPRHGAPAGRGETRGAQGSGSLSLMLHAWAVDLVHPVTGERLSLRTPVPVRFAEWFPDAELLLAGM